MKIDWKNRKIRAAAVIAPLILVNLLFWAATDYTGAIFLAVLELYVYATFLICRMVARSSCNHWFFRFNIGFVVVACIIFEFSWFFFPEIWEELKNSGSVLPPITLFFGPLFWLVSMYPAAYIFGCTVYYVVSLRAFKAQTNAVIDIGMLGCFILVVLLSFGGMIFWLATKPSDAEVLQRWRLQAEQGDAWAEEELGGTYRYGSHGIKQDYMEAIRWYRKAAEQGQPAATVTLGEMYEQGQGVKRDYAEAYFWYSVADHGFGHNGDSAKAHLTQEQIAAVEKRVLEWRRTHPKPAAAPKPP